MSVFIKDSAAILVCLIENQSSVQPHSSPPKAACIISEIQGNINIVLLNWQWLNTDYPPNNS